MLISQTFCTRIDRKAFVSPRLCVEILTGLLEIATSHLLPIVNQRVLPHARITKGYSARGLTQANTVKRP